MFPAAIAPLLSQFNLTALSQLYNSTDFIGISSYPSLTPDFDVQQLETATEQFDFEIGQFGVNLTMLNTVMVKSDFSPVSCYQEFRSHSIFGQV